MARKNRNAEADHLARALAEAPGNETLLLAGVKEIQRLVAELPDRDTRTAEEILEYDAHGLPG